MSLLRGYFAGVGSRETPEDILLLMEELAYAAYLERFALSSGDAIGADIRFYTGAIRSPNFKILGARIYLAWDGVGGRYANEAECFLDATRYPTYEQAKELACEARGSFEGLGRGGIALHVRNVYQIRGHTLEDIVKALFYWAKPVGKTEKVKGGTNTALQLAIRAVVPLRLNLYKDEDRQRAVDFITKTLSKERL